MRLLYFRAILLIALLAAALPARGAEHADALPDAALEASVREFLEAFINPEQTPEDQARFFLEGAEYYRHGPSSRQAISADIRRYATRWPKRAYRLQHIEYLKPDPSSDAVFVSYVVKYDVANAKTRVRGRARYGAVITNVHSEPRIALIMERIQGRRR